MFKKGISGNPAGRPRRELSWKTVLQIIGEEQAGETLMTRKEAVARILWREAAKGEAWAINAIMDRMDGKPKQSLDHTTDGEKIESITRVIVDSAKTSGQ